MCRRVGNTLTMPRKSGSVRELQSRWRNRTCNCWKTIQWTLFPSPTMPVGSPQGIQLKGENSGQYLCLSEESLPRKLRMGLADWPSWSPHYAEHHLGSLSKTSVYRRKWTRRRWYPKWSRGDWRWLPDWLPRSPHQSHAGGHQRRWCCPLGLYNLGMYWFGLCRDRRNEEALRLYLCRPGQRR